MELDQYSIESIIKDQADPRRQQETQINLARRSSSSTVEEYLDKPNTRKEKLEEIDSQIDEPMLPECIGTVVVPAYNEATNIKSFLESLDKQTFSPTSGFNNRSLEILIVVNNTTDGTEKIANEWLSQHGYDSLETAEKMKVRVIFVNFPNGERGVGAARKLGADLALLRSKKRVENDNNEFYLLGLDADNSGLAPDHLEKYIETFRKTNTHLLGGFATISMASIPPELKTVGEFFEAQLDYLKTFPRFPGFNHGIDRELYIKVGGYPRTIVGEECYLEDEARKQGNKVTFIDTPIILNIRRVVSNPWSFFTGQAYDPVEFIVRNTDIRRGEIRPVSWSDDEYRFLSTRLIDHLAVMQAKHQGSKVNEELAKQRKSFSKYLEQKGREAWAPDDRLFWIGYGTESVVRYSKNNEERQVLLKQGLNELADVIAGTNAFISGGTAEWVHTASGSKEVPFVPSVAVWNESLEVFVQEMKEKGWGLFKLNSWEGGEFCERVNSQDGPLVATRRLIFLREDEYGTPILEEGNLPCWGLTVFQKKGGEFGINGRPRLLALPGGIVKDDLNGKNVRITDRMLTMALLPPTSQGRNTLRTLYEGSSESEKKEYIEYLREVVNVYTNLIEQRLSSISHLDGDEGIRKILTLVDELVEKPQEEWEEARRKLIIEKLSSVISMEPDEQREKIKELVKDFSVAEFLKSEVMN